MPGNGLDTLASGKGQDDAGAADLIPGQRVAAGDLL
jgi:hypothetical protein